MEVRLTPGGTTVPEAPPGEGVSVRQAPVAEPREVLPHRDSGASVQDRPAGLDKEDLKSRSAVRQRQIQKARYFYRILIEHFVKIAETEK